MAIISRIILKDEYSGQAKKIISSAESLNKAFGKSQSESKKLDSSLSKAFGKKHKLTIKDTDSKKVIKNVNTINGDLKKVTGKKNKIKIGLDGGNVVTQTIDKIKNKLSNLGGGGGGSGGKGGLFSRVSSGIKGSLSAVGAGAKGLVMSAGPLLAGAVGTIGAGAMAGKMWQSGSALEQQQISMKHFLGGDQKKSGAYLKQLRNNANVTPFETGEVVQAGTRAVQIAGGDTKKGMEFVKLAEDMAALNPGKSISDAMEALADADMGEMERLKEFGYKGSKEEYDKAGGDLFKMKDVKGNTLQGMYKGGAEKLSMSAEGLISTIKGKIGSGMADAGLKLIDSLKPVLEKLVPVADKIAEALPNVVDKVIEGVQKANEVITPIFEKIKSFLAPIIDTISEGMQNLSPILSELATVSLPFIQSILGVISDLYQNLLKPALTVVADVVKNILQKAFEVLGDIIQNVVIPVIETLTDFINNVLRPIFEELSTIIRETVLPVIKKVADYLAEKLYSAFKKVTDIGTKLADKFREITGAVSEAVKGLRGIGDRISGAVTGAVRKAYNKVTGKEVKNANGTSYYQGGRTLINERGQELIDLPKGSRIYPQGKTDEIIRNDLNKQSKSNSKVVYYQPKITINGSNMDKKELLYEVEKRLKRLAVNV